MCFIMDTHVECVQELIIERKPTFLLLFVNLEVMERTTDVDDSFNTRSEINTCCPSIYKCSLL